MISWTDVNELQKQKTELQVRLKELLNINASNDDINELKAEILHLEKNINRILGTNEVKRQKELASVKSGADERNKKRYYAFKRKYSMISKLNEATNNILKVIDSLSNNYEVSSERVKVKS